MPDPREPKLPKWAQEELRNLRNKLETEKRRADEARIGNGGPDSDTFIDPYDEVPIRLGRETRINFVLGDKFQEYFDVQIKRYHGDVYLEVHGGTGMVITPQVSNVIQIRTAER
jgi:hypothetical protein